MVSSSLPSIEEAKATQTKIANDPAWFFENVLGCKPYAEQIAMAESVRDFEQTSVNGANAVGKDWMVGRIILWWQCSRWPAKTIITGPTARQVHDIVWKETREAYHSSKVPLGGRMMPVESRWEGADNHFVLGFSTDKPFNLTGFHSPNLLVIVTEAHNFSDLHMVGLRRLLPNRMLLSGNPFSESGTFFDSHHDKRDLYNAITITAWETPNVKDNASIPGLVTKDDIRKMAEEYGEESAIYKATVNAEFAASVGGLIPLSWLLRAKEPRDNIDASRDIDGGLDVAGPGEDETVLTLVRGSDILLQESWHESDPRGQVMNALMPYQGRLRRVNVDSAGIGWGMYTHLSDFEWINAQPINVGESPRDSDKFRNLKAELYWGLRERFKDEDIHGLPQEAVGQLSSIRYKHNSRGQVEIESKEDAAKRGVKSPDRAESVMLAYAETKSNFEFL